MKFIQVQIILLKKKTLFPTNEDFSEIKYVEEEGTNDKRLFFIRKQIKTLLVHYIKSALVETNHENFATSQR